MTSHGLVASRPPWRGRSNRILLREQPRRFRYLRVASFRTIAVDVMLQNTRAAAGDT